MAAIVSGVQVATAGPASAGIDKVNAKYADRVVDRGFITMFDRLPDAATKDYWYPRVVEKRSAAWFVQAMMAGAEYQRRLGGLSDAAFISRLYSNATDKPATVDEVTMWSVALRQRTHTRASMITWFIENRFTYVLTRPNRAVSCSRYTRGGPIVPLCSASSAGDQRGVTTINVRGTNIYVNQAWMVEVSSFISAGRQAGFDLQATRTDDVPWWMISPGSWRSWDDQLWLYQHGYPANPPGKSMHEWALAIDFDCNGKYITDVKSCWSWARSNGPKFHLKIFKGVSDINASEAWHFSTNAL